MAAPSPREAPLTRATPQVVIKTSRTADGS
jgi:hypothetical protein